MKKKIKVLIVGSDSSVKGGITSVIDRFLNYKWDDIDIELLPTYIEGSKIKRVLFFFRAIAKYIKKLMKNDFDIAHIHMSYKGSFYRKYLIVKMSNLFKRTTILHLHGSEFEIFYNKSNKIIKRLIRDIFECCDSVIVLGKVWESVVKEIAPKSNINIFNNAVNIPDYRVEWNEDKINILFLGVLIKRKGIYELIEAIKVLNQEGTIKEKGLNFVIGGSGPEEERIKEIISDYNLEHCVQMSGWVNGALKEKLLKKSQVFILPSYNEGLPMAILEAMSYGIPVISTNVGSIAEVVKEGITGTLIKKGNVEEIIYSINNEISDVISWNKKSKMCKEIIENNFSENIYFENIRNLYNEILKI